MDSLSQVEAMEARRKRREVIYDRIARDGCCGGQMSMSGRCPETGHICPMFLKAEKIQKRVFEPQEDDG